MSCRNSTLYSYYRVQYQDSRYSILIKKRIVAGTAVVASQKIDVAPLPPDVHHWGSRTFRAKVALSLRQRRKHTLNSLIASASHPDRTNPPDRVVPVGPLVVVHCPQTRRYVRLDFHRVQQDLGRFYISGVIVASMHFSN